MSRRSRLDNDRKHGGRELHVSSFELLPPSFHTSFHTHKRKSDLYPSIGALIRGEGA